MRWPARALLLALALTPGTAAALSCLPPNPAAELDSALQRGLNPQVLIGRLTTPFDNDNGRYRFEGRLIGHGITIDKLSSGIEVSASCIAEWCGELPRRPVEGLFVAAGGTGGLKVTIDPCGSGIYPEPPPEEQIEFLARCLEERGCAPEDFPQDAD